MTMGKLYREFLHLNNKITVPKFLMAKRFDIPQKKIHKWTVTRLFKCLKM